jgi:hypothetical protein
VVEANATDVEFKIWESASADTASGTARFTLGTNTTFDTNVNMTLLQSDMSAELFFVQIKKVL